MAEKCILESAIGETRAVVTLKNKPVEFYIRRWSEAGQARAGDVFSGRITSVDKVLMAAFIDLGDGGAAGLLRFTMTPNAPRLTEGQMVRVQILRDAEPGKGPLVQFMELSDAKKPGPEKITSLEDTIKSRFPDIEVSEGRVDGIEHSAETEVPIPGGGYAYVEQTRAGTMIDIDTAGGQKTKVSISAAKEIAAHIRLRGIGGLIVIDFPNFRKKKDRADVWQTLKDCLENDPNITKIAPFSRFDVVELTRSRNGPSIAQIINTTAGIPSTETIALAGLRQLEKEARVDGGAKLVLQLPKNAYDWLESDRIGWREPLSDRIGSRYRLEIGNEMQVFKDET
jgi:Ribonuclease G/E